MSSQIVATDLVEDPFRDLVKALIDQAAHRGLGAESENVILDVEIDGVRCLLVMPEPSDNAVALSPREREIVAMVAQGYPNKTIAASLGISSWTVSTHLRRIFAKLGVRSRAAMVARVVESGLAANGPAAHWHVSPLA